MNAKLTRLAKKNPKTGLFEFIVSFAIIVVISVN